MPRRSMGRPPFDEVAEAYDHVRPGYPDPAVDDLLALAAVPPRGRVVEVGAGTGQLSVSLAERGHRLTAVELGPHLADRLRRNLRDYRDADVVHSQFEDAELQHGSYDLVTAATSFHWLDQDVAFTRAAALLRPSGALGLLFNLHVDVHDGFFGESEAVYARHAPELDGPDKAGRLGDHDHWRRAFAESGLFGEVQTRSHPWRMTYARKAYLELLSTYSNHIALPPDARAGLFRDLGALIDERYRGRVEKHYDAFVVVAPVLAAKAG